MFIDWILNLCGCFEIFLLGLVIVCLLLEKLILGLNVIIWLCMFVLEYVGLKKVFCLLVRLVVVVFLLDEVYFIVELICC